MDLFPEYNPFFEKQIVEAWDHLKDAVPRMLASGVKFPSRFATALPWIRSYNWPGRNLPT